MSLYDDTANVFNKEIAFPFLLDFLFQSLNENLTMRKFGKSGFIHVRGSVSKIEKFSVSMTGSNLKKKKNTQHTPKKYGMVQNRCSSCLTFVIV